MGVDRGSTTTFRPSHMSTIVWLLPGLIALTLLFVVPFALVYWKSFTDPVPGLQNYQAILSNSLYVRVLWNTIVSAFWTTIGCLIIGYPLAYAIFRSSNRLRFILLGAVLFAYSVGTVPRSFAWLVVLGDRGVINQLRFLVTDATQPIYLLYNLTGVLIGMIHVMLPFMTLLAPRGNDPREPKVGACGKDTWGDAPASILGSLPPSDPARHHRRCHAHLYLFPGVLRHPGSPWRANPDDYRDANPEPSARSWALGSWRCTLRASSRLPLCLVPSSTSAPQG